MAVTVICRHSFDLCVGRRAFSRRTGLLVLVSLGIVGVAVIAVAGVWLFPPHPTTAQASTMPPLPPGWPATMELGMSSGQNEAAAMWETAPFRLRYQYLAGGVNTGHGWATWSPDGGFVSAYIRESSEQGIITVFTYY